MLLFCRSGMDGVRITGYVTLLFHFWDEFVVIVGVRDIWPLSLPLSRKNGGRRLVAN